MGEGFLALIPARGGSKGIPGKNVADLCGKPLIAWTIEAALESRSVDRVVVSTDDREIAEISQHFGAEVPFSRPPELAKDDTPGMEPIFHAIQALSFRGNILVLQPTSPLRMAKHIDEMVDESSRAGATSAISVRKVKDVGEWQIERQSSGFLVDNGDSSPPLRRQETRPLFVPNGAIYLGDTETLLESGKFGGGGCYLYVMRALDSIDIDEADDMVLAEMAMRYRLRRRKVT